MSTTWFHSFGVRRPGCTCDYNMPRSMRCNDEWMRCQGAVNARIIVSSLILAFRDVDEALAMEIVNIIEGNSAGGEDPVYNHEKLPRRLWWENETMRNRNRTHAALELLNILLEMHGVEVETFSDQDGDEVVVSYLNTGDQYALTIIEMGDEFFLASWDDIQKMAAASDEEKWMAVHGRGA